MAITTAAVKMTTVQPAITCSANVRTNMPPSKKNPETTCTAKCENILATASMSPSTLSMSVPALVSV